MSGELLLEIGTEEIPAGFLSPALEGMKNLLQTELKTQRIHCEKIIKVEHTDEMIPKPYIWYNYYGKIFVSVYYTKNKERHIREKSENIEMKKKSDNYLSPWHLEWQYKRIAANA